MTGAEAERLAEQLDPTVSYEEDWDPDRWDDIDWAWDVLSSQDTASKASIDAPAVKPLPQKADLPRKVNMRTGDLSDCSILSCLTHTQLSFLRCRPDILSPVQQICCVP